MAFIGRAVAPAPISANDVPDLPASKITSGTFADSRLSSSSVTQHAQSVDLQPVKSDITALALREATNESSASFNLPNQHIDTFATDTLGTKTNAFIDTGFCATVGTSAESGGTLTDNDGISSWGYPSGAISKTTDSWSFVNNSYNHTAEQRGTFLSGNYWWSFKVDDSTMQSFSANLGSTTAGQQAFSYGIRVHTGNISDTGNGIYNLNDGNIFYINFAEVSNSEKVHFMDQQTTQATLTDVDLIGTYITFLRLSSGSLKVYTSATQGDYVTGRLLHTYSGFSSTGDNKVVFGRAHNNGTSFGSGIKFVDDVNYKYGITTLSTLVSNATGNFISNAITAPSSTSKMGAIITYQDNAGTNTLNTDIVLQLSADNGSNFTTATMTAMPDFATGIKMAKVNDLSVTAGTQLKYKISLANQSLGSKEARIRGVSLQY